jgi:putative phage-type endonuclease
MKLVELVQGSQEWLSFRNTKIGASDAPIIMQKSPWTTPYQLWKLKMGLHTTEENESMRRGLQLEPNARQKFIEVSKIEMSPAVGIHDDIDYMSSSFDGLSKCRKYALEIKCPVGQDHEMAMDGAIPEKYIPQLQHQMEVSGLDSIFYFSYKNDQSYNIITIEKDLNFIKDLLKQEKAFWECVKNLEAPDLIDRDYIPRNEEEWLLLAKEFLELSDLEEKKEMIRKKLIALSGNSNSIGGGIKLSKITRKGNVDYKAIPELKGLDLEKYRKGNIETYRIGVC